ncbi:MULTISPECIES: low molecular weight phosphatase family protein [Sphingobacterium]|uniref:arsenate-mycothiol transferase ArsC n=1 Tax=Sphingobacterium TaxID=28453 RepID=UPI00257D4643|nr:MULTISPECIES: protein-tyrosine-phosphatase [Sphingobacterium]
MNDKILETIGGLSSEAVSVEREMCLQPLIAYLNEKVDKVEGIRLNFICTHNSRRSHLSQVWAQTMAHHFGLKDLFCYSGGTEATAMFPKVAETLASQGFEILQLAEGSNPVYAVKYAPNEPPIMCFSKVYDNRFNPANGFGAIMTCSNADEGCPIVMGAEARFPIKYEDPKISDGTPEQTQVYRQRSLEIACEMFYVFSQIKK